MKKHNIIQNRPELTQEQIDKGMDFSKVTISAASVKSGAIKKIAITALGTVLIVASALVFFNNQSIAPISKKENEALKTKGNELKTFQIDASKDTTLLFETGSIINILANSLVDENGNAITGMVEIRYREFHNLGEIILSGIKMTYDSSGTEYHFESAGMFEILAFQNNRPVFVADNKSIQVKMVSLDSKKEKFNQYFLNPSNNSWEYIGEDTPEISSFPYSSANNSNSFDVIKPKVKRKKGQQFTISINYENFPELMAFDQVLFEVSPDTKNFNPKTANIKWEDVEIKRIDKTNKFTVSFINDSTSYSVIAFPVVDEKDLKKSKAKWDFLYQNYQATLNKRETKQQEASIQFNKQISFYEKAQDLYNRLAKKDEQMIKNVQLTEGLIFRNFQVNGFGIWNSDCPNSMPQESIVKAIYKGVDGNVIEVKSVSLINKDLKTQYYLYEGKTVYYNPESNNLLLVITKDNQIGVFNSEDFKQLNKNAKTQTFVLSLTAAEVYIAEMINDLIFN